MNILNHYDTDEIFEGFEELPMLNLFPEPKSKETGYYVDFTFIKNRIIFHNVKKENIIFDFVLTANSELHIGLKHLLLSNNAEQVKGGASLKVYHGKINWISNDCGHYKPTDLQMHKLICFFQKMELMHPEFVYINYLNLKI